MEHLLTEKRRKNFRRLGLSSAAFFGLLSADCASHTGSARLAYGLRVDDPAQYESLCERSPEVCDRDPDRGVFIPFELSSGIQEVQRIFSDFQGTFQLVNDVATRADPGGFDRWEINEVYGDCEDAVFTLKRRLNQELQIPLSAMGAAILSDPERRLEELHMVLVVSLRDKRGMETNYGIDILYDRIVPVRELGVLLSIETGYWREVDYVQSSDPLVSDQAL